MVGSLVKTLQKCVLAGGECQNCRVVGGRSRGALSQLESSLHLDTQHEDEDAQLSLETPICE